MGRGWLRAAVAESVRRLFIAYALVSLIPIVVLGGVLLAILHRNGDDRGLSEARDKAELIARTAMAPVVSNRPLPARLPEREVHALRRTIDLAVNGGDVLRLRVRDLAGAVVFSSDGSGLSGPVEDEVVDAAGGEVVASLTRLNTDSNDTGGAGPRVVEIYQPLDSATTGRRIGVLELYVPYAPIASAIGAEQRTVTVALGAGLGLLWLVLLAVSASATRRMRRQLARTRFLAAHDVLTGLPNRTTFSHDVAAAVARGEQIAVAVLDLDGFKHVNDVLGHEKGDQLLVQLAAKLRRELTPADRLARLGGDEFGILLSGARHADSVLGDLAALRRVISTPVEVDAVPLVLEASVGVAFSSDESPHGASLLQRADVAMYVAKRQQLGVVRYCAEYDTYDASALSLLAELRRAVENDELVLHYQCKGDLADSRVHEVEALVRWQHPTRGLIYPDAFIPLAEQTELVDLLTRWVVRTAVGALPALDPTGRLAVAVNVSARSLTRSDLADELLGILDAASVQPDRLVVEITETALMSDPAAAAHTLMRLHAAGTRISIDDFGAGQTSLGYLATLPVSELKIDKTFVIPMLSDVRKDAIVRSVIELGHSLGCTVTAEGVEDAAILERLKVLDCDTAQGYYLARPAALLDVPAATTQAVAALGSASLAAVR